MAIRSPIIPTMIRVHLGAPDASARNITVPFTEYIKNVASSEIYPNWPDDALKANILAQISFALNRIYNEWYPSKGYNFDITNSPIYDQAFRENAQFFDRISQIVDETFNNYIVKGNQVQPLYAQYCDGKNTTCSGLSQWGSLTLANQGKSPIEILRNYYGNDIKIIYNAPVEDNIMTYPGFPVEIGTSGDFVRLLKIQLNRIGRDYPAIPAIIDDSIYFTVDTENAVKKFQEIFNLPINGIVDKQTWYKIKYIYNAVKKITSIYTEGIGIDEASLVFNRTIQLGDEGDPVTALNYYINTIAYFDADIPYLDLKTPVFTEDTKQMVIAFQNKYKIKANGIVDANTWKALREAYKQTLQKVPETCMCDINEFFSGRYLSYDMTGEDVVNLQKFLYLICSKDHSIPGVLVNGTYDRLTQQSVKSLQRRFGLEDTGVVGPATWYRIVELSKE